MALTALPPELLNYVITNITSKPTLYNLMRCSHQLYLYTVPHLLRHVTIQEDIRLGKERVGELENFASSIIRKPDLASLVRSFTLHVAQPPSSRVKYTEELEEPDASHDQIIVNAMNASSLSSEEKIKCLGQFSHTHRCHYDLVLALLLPALLKVEKLVLDVKIQCNTYYLEEMIGRAARRESPFDTRPPFETLTVFVHSHDIYNTRGTGFFASLLKLPTIQEISGGFESMWSEEAYEKTDINKVRITDKNLTELDSSSSPLTSLDLEAYRLSTADLGHMLRAPKALKNLFFKVCPPECLDFAALRHALRPQQNCLESLGFDFAELDDESGRFCGPMTSFINFNALKILKIPLLFLKTTDSGTERDNLIGIFPPSLETLHLTRFRRFDAACFEGLLEALEHLLAQKSPRQIPSLKRLIVEGSYSLDPSFSPRRGATLVKFNDVLLWNNIEAAGIKRFGMVVAAHGVTLDVKGDSAEEDEWVPVDLSDEPFFETESPLGLQWEMLDMSEEEVEETERAMGLQ